MKEKRSLIIKTIGMLVVILMCYILIKESDVTVEKVLGWTPGSPWLAAAFLMLLYSIKSVTIFLPLLIPEIAAGIVFPLGVALLLNTLGSCIDLTLPYLVGKFGGGKQLKMIRQRYPQIESLVGGKKSPLLMGFLLRIVYLPGDLVTMYFGACGIRFWPCLLGGLLGHLPSILLATILGVSIEDPQSPAFWITAVLMIVLSVVSVVIYYFYHKKTEAAT